MLGFRTTLGAAVALALLPAVAVAQDTTLSYAFAEFGEPALSPEFEHWPYANPDAPKGGDITLGAFGSFDSLNSVPTRGEYPRSLGLLYDSLMVESQDEVGVYYPLIAESVEYPDDLSWIEFNLRPEARFHDGEPITAEDVVWTFETIMEVGRPFLRAVYDDVAGAEIVDEHRVRFSFTTTNTTRPLANVAGLAVYPQHWWTAEGRSLAEPTLEPPLGSGPYRLARVEGGRSLIYERAEDYWAADLPVNRGLWNFDRVRYDYYRDQDIQFEAFLGGAYDFRIEFSSRNWGIGYDTPAVANSRIVREEVPAIEYRGMQGYFFNTREPQFRDQRVREALNYLYPYEFVRESAMYGLRERIVSYFPGAEGYAWEGLPEGRELEILEEYRGRIPDWIFSEEPSLPDSANPGRPGVPRESLRTALALLAEAGWQVENQRLVNTDGEQMRAEILLQSPSLEPHTAPFVEVMRQVGIDASIRYADSAQYQRRYQEFDFEIISFAYTFFPPPGGTERNRFHSGAAAVEGSANISGISDPVIDDLLDRMVAASELEEKQALTRALDRVLLAGWYVVPHWYSTDVWAAWIDRFGRPDREPRFNFGAANGIAFQPTWWAADAEAATPR